jgi:MFS family permease
VGGQPTGATDTAACAAPGPALAHQPVQRGRYDVLFKASSARDILFVGSWTFAALAAIAASGALAHAMLEHIVVWIALRGLLGFCFAGLYMVSESWLNRGTDNHIRGRLLSIYMVVNMAGLAAGKMLLAISEPSSFLLFGVATICISLALVPVSLTRSLVPSPPQHVTLRLDLLYQTAPIGVVGCLAVGMTNGAFWSLGPVFADARFISISGVALFMSVVVVGAMAEARTARSGGSPSSSLPSRFSSHL